MSRYDRHYDYGLRGYAETSPEQLRETFRAPRYDQDGLFFNAQDRRNEPRSSRVTARYNNDYVYGARGEVHDPRYYGYPRNFNMFTGDRPDRIGDGRYFRQPYTTIGGTRTNRGSSIPMGYDRDFDDYDRQYSQRTRWF
ncbi:MAG: hypothetical protein H0X65_04835 [Gemmatimonadetes bacterium]|nr:hypothetical protein [Gemmatimonadota bacterium]